MVTEMNGLNEAFVNAVYTVIVESAETITPKNIATEVNGVCNLGFAVGKINEVA